MIDWITVILPYPHSVPIQGGRITSVDLKGNTEWEKIKGLRAEGSHDCGVLIKTSSHNYEGGTHLWLSGNPAKFIQGHNITGSDDLCLLVAVMADKILTDLGYCVSDEQYHIWREGHFELKTIDINYMRHCGSRKSARAMLRLIQHSANMRHSGRGEFTGDTLYFAKRSRRRAIKVYIKGDEIENGGKGHGLSPYFPLERRQELLRIADDALRIELRLHSLELKELGLRDARKWRHLDVKELFNHYISTIKFSANLPIAKETLLSLPRHLQCTYALWKEGIDLRTELRQASYYRHRRELLKFNIDIGATRIYQDN